MPESYKTLPKDECISKMISYLADKHTDWKHDKVVAVAHKECGASRADALSYLLTEEETFSVMKETEEEKKKRKKLEEELEDFERGTYSRCIQRLKYMGYSEQEAAIICSDVFLGDTKLFGEEREPTEKELKAHKYRYDPRTRHTGGHPTHVEIGVKPRAMALPLQAPHRPMKSPNIMRTKLERIQTLEERFLTLEELAKRSQYQKAVTKTGKGVKGQKKYTLKKEDAFFVDCVNKILDFFPEYNIKDAIEFALNNNFISIAEQDEIEGFQDDFGKRMVELLDAGFSQDEAYVKAYVETLENIQDDIFAVDTITIDSINQLNNVIKAPITLAHEMVQKYKDGKHFKPYEELEKAIEYLDEIPIIIEHKRFSENDIVGYVKELRADPESRSIKGMGYFIESRLSTPTLHKIASGDSFPVSIGFFAVLTSGGEFNGERYDATQTNIKINHLALCERSIARCPPDKCGVNVGDSSDNQINNNIELINKKNYYLNIKDYLEEKENNIKKKEKINMKDAVVSDDMKKIFSKLFDFLGMLPYDKREDAKDLLTKLLDKKEEEDEEKEEKMEKKEDSKEEELRSQIKELKDSICGLKEELQFYKEKEKKELKDSILKFSQFKEEELKEKTIDQLRIIEDAVSRFDPSMEDAKMPKPEEDKSFEDSDKPKRENPRAIFSETNERFGL